jgi:hypothetical protein
MIPIGSSEINTPIPSQQEKYFDYLIAMVTVLLGTPLPATVIVSD